MLTEIVATNIAPDRNVVLFRVDSDESWAQLARLLEQAGFNRVDQYQGEAAAFRSTKQVEGQPETIYIEREHRVFGIKIEAVASIPENEAHLVDTKTGQKIVIKNLTAPKCHKHTDTEMKFAQHQPPFDGGYWYCGTCFPERQT
jgi:hypothetical protein